MLVLSRNRNENIDIGDDIKINVVDIIGNKVRLGITAPRHIPVMRSEIVNDLDKARHALKVLSSPQFEKEVLTSFGKNTESPLTKLRAAQALAQSIIPQDDFREEIDQETIERLLPETTDTSLLDKLKPVVNFVIALARCSNFKSSIQKAEQALTACSRLIPATKA